MPSCDAPTTNSRHVPLNLEVLHNNCRGLRFGHRGVEYDMIWVNAVFLLLAVVEKMQKHGRILQTSRASCYILRVISELCVCAVEVQHTRERADDVAGHLVPGS